MVVVLAPAQADVGAPVAAAEAAPPQLEPEPDPEEDPVAKAEGIGIRPTPPAVAVPVADVVANVT